MTDYWLEIIAAIGGAVIYLWLSSKDTPQSKGGAPKEATPPAVKRATPPPAAKAEPEPAAPTPPPAPSPRRAAPAPAPAKKAPEPVTFEQLLEQFGQPKKPISRAEREEKFGTDDDFASAEKKRTERWRELSEFYTEKSAVPVGTPNKASLLKEDKVTHRKSNYFAELLQNPDNLRNAIVLKEIFDKKHF